MLKSLASLRSFQSCLPLPIWIYLRPQGFTYEDAQKVPQTDRLGKKSAWAALENLPLGDLDSNPDATFKWWLWLANLGPHTRTTLGAGVVGAALTFSDNLEKRIICRRVDGSTIEKPFLGHVVL